MDSADTGSGDGLKRFCLIGVPTLLLTALGLYAAAEAATGGFFPGIGYALGAAGSLLWAVTLSGICLHQVCREKGLPLRFLGLLLAAAPFLAVTIIFAGADAIFMGVYLLIGLGDLVVAYGAYRIAGALSGGALRPGGLILGIALLAASIIGFALVLG